MADYAIHPITGKKQEIHSQYPQIRQNNQAPDCLFCANAGICEKHKGMFFIGEKYEPCENYKCRRKVEIEEPNRKRADDAAKKAAIKSTTKPVPRPPGAPEDCLHCKLLIESYRCRARMGLAPYQGEGRVCENYLEVNVRPEGEDKNCIYCLTNFHCERGRVKKGIICDRYKEFVMENTESISA